MLVSYFRITLQGDKKGSEILPSVDIGLKAQSCSKALSI